MLFRFIYHNLEVAPLHTRPWKVGFVQAESIDTGFTALHDVTEYWDGGSIKVFRVGRVVDEKTKELLAILQAYPDVRTEWERPHSLSALPFIPISFVNRAKVLNFFSNDHYSRGTAFDHRARTSPGMYVSGGRKVRKESL